MATLFGVDVLLQLIQIKCFSEGLTLPALLSTQKKECHRATDYVTTHMLPSIYSILEMCCHATQTFPILRVLQPSFIEYERERKVGEGQIYSVEGHVLRERKHMPPFFFFMNPFSFVS